MISPRILRRRIRSIQNTAKITRAMEMIATARMRKAQEQALSGRPYSEKIGQIIADLAIQFSSGGSLHPLLETREVKKIAIVHITTNRGLCGGLNANLNRNASNFILEKAIPVSLITVGSKGRDFMRRSRRNIYAEFTDISDRPSLLETLPISRIIIDEYIAGNIDRVYVSYPKFINLMVQQPTLETLLPVEPAIVPKSESTEYIYEPHATYVLGELLPRFVEMKIYHAIIELMASEQSARMIAMRSATDNANELITDLTLVMNKARQDMITKELLDISGGVEALH